MKEIFTAGATTINFREDLRIGMTHSPLKYHWNEDLLFEMKSVYLIKI